MRSLVQEKQAKERTKHNKILYTTISRKNKIKNENKPS